MNSMKLFFTLTFLTTALLTPGKKFSLLPAKHPLQQDSPKVSVVPSSFGFDPYYKKYIDANGIPIISSSKVPDAALLQARKIVAEMLSNVKLPDAAKTISQNKIRVAVMSKDELTTDIPEHSDLNRAFPETNWDTRARGLGATL